MPKRSTAGSVLFNQGCEKQTEGHWIDSVKCLADGQYLGTVPVCEGETAKLTNSPLIKLDPHDGDVVVSYSASQSLRVKEFVQFVFRFGQKKFRRHRILVLKALQVPRSSGV